MAHDYSFKNKLLILRLHRLTHIPSARHGAEILFEKGLPVELFEFGAENENESVLQAGIPTVRFGLGWVSHFPSTLRAAVNFARTFFYLFSRIKKERPKFFLTHGLQEQWVAYLLHKVFKIPFACHIHEIYEHRDLRRFNRLLFWGEGIVLRAAEFTIFSSEERAAIYRERYYLKGETYIAFNTPRVRKAVPSEAFLSQQGISPDKKVLLYIGGIGPLNATLEILESLSYLSSDFVLIFAGWGDEKYIDEMIHRAKALNIADKVRFVGPVSNKWEWIDNADAGFCIYHGVELRARYNAGPSNKLWEFISAGKPVIANRAHDFVRIVKENHLGINVDTKKPKEMAQSIERLFQDEVGLKKIEQTAKELHLKRFNYEAQFEEVTHRLTAALAAADFDQAA